VARLVAIGAVAGIFSSLFGVGGGIIVVPLLLLALRWDERAATATSLAAILVTALAGVVVYAWHGEVQPAEAALVGIPGAFGALAGTTLQQRVTNRALAAGFALLLAVVGVTLLVA
jgi:uncharacterized membrane protein YfcA